MDRSRIACHDSHQLLTVIGLSPSDPRVGDAPSGDPFPGRLCEPLEVHVVLSSLVQAYDRLDVLLVFVLELLRGAAVIPFSFGFPL